MASFSRLIRFKSPDGRSFYADLNHEPFQLPSQGTMTDAYRSFEDLLARRNPVEAIFHSLVAPLPRDDLPIYCVGLNYKSHAEEAHLNVPLHPPVWTKPAASLAFPGEDISLSKFCASNFPDFEGELVFVTSKECRDVSPAEAESFILGYSVGNDLTCRMFQLPDRNGGQFFYAKAFDKFAPIGPVLVSPEVYGRAGKISLVTRVNGKVTQSANVTEDMIFSPVEILSFMSQSTTIPAYTVVMTGTPSGVGAFKKPRQALGHEDVVEVAITSIGSLHNRILLPDGQSPIDMVEVPGHDDGA
ncbi:fumarylacetoacetate hydrolase [Aspergillus bertholletiae]|uniref:Fumarylacetoacetate hydrolase n=1 Tax=Aspergillus bertholletiae TaxID=1226010 RepID=A0A5N7B8X1_9EURO|nr:fumarylacetoacetate hydrolase [Aspergillus bertholletiae]